MGGNLKILQVVSFFKPSWEAGGIARVCYEISKKLADKGHEVTIYTTDGFKSRLKVKKNQPVNVENMNVYYFRNLSNFLAKRNLCIPYLLPYISKRDLQQFDVIHVHTFRTILAISIWYYAKKYGVPYVLQAHGSVLPFFQKQRLKKLYDWVWGYRILKDASKVLAYQQIETTQYQDMGVNRDKIEILTSGFDLPKTEDMPKIGKFKKKYSIGDNEKVILFLGRIHKIKGLDLLINAFADLTKKINNVRLVIVGPDDGYLSTINNLIKSLRLESKILITGFISPNDKIAAYVDADVYVLPSRYDIFPTTVLEACSFGTPIITTDQTGIRDLVNNNVGYVVPFDKNQLCNALFKILTDARLRYYFGERGKKLIKEKYSWDKIVEQLEKIYNSIK